MKKKSILLNVFIVLLSLSFSSCSSKNSYSLTVYDNYNFTQLNSFKSHYKVGEKIKVKLPPYSGLGPGVIFNDVYYNPTGYVENENQTWPEYYYIILTMPSHNSVLYTTINGITGFDEINSI